MVIGDPSLHQPRAEQSVRVWSGCAACCARAGLRLGGLPWSAEWATLRTEHE